MIIVLDTNVFYGDVGAERALLSAVLDGAASGDYELVVPEVVIQELVRQYPDRLRDARKSLTTTLDAMARLNIAPKDPPGIDHAVLEAEYEAKLRLRFGGAGRRVAEHPKRMEQISGWAVGRRKPFKSDGSGFPDALIWGTVLDLAPATESLLLVTANAKDFGDSEALGELATDLRRDLTALGVAETRVRLVLTVQSLVDEVVMPLADADARARRLLTRPDLHDRLLNALAEGTVYRPLPFEEFDLGVHLDNEPQASGLTIYRAELISAREGPGGRLILSLRAICHVLLDLIIYKGDYEEAEEDAYEISVTNPDLNDHYLSAQTELEARLHWNVVTDPRVKTTEIEIAGMEPVTAEEVLAEWLVAGAEESLYESLNSGADWSLPGYLPEGLETAADEAMVETFNADDVEIDRVDDRDFTDIQCSLNVYGSGHVRWHLAAPSGRDIESSADAELEGGLIQGVSTELLAISVEATINRELEWLNIEVVDVSLALELDDRSQT